MEKVVDRDKLAYEAGRIHFIKAVSKLINLAVEGSVNKDELSNIVADLYLAHEFFVLAKEFDEANGPDSYLESLGFSSQGIANDIEKKGEDYLDSAKQFLDDLCRNYSKLIKKGKVRKAIKECYKKR